MIVQASRASQEQEIVLMTVLTFWASDGVDDCSLTCWASREEGMVSMTLQ